MHTSGVLLTVLLALLAATGTNSPTHRAEGVLIGAIVLLFLAAGFGLAVNLLRRVQLVDIPYLRRLRLAPKDVGDRIVRDCCRLNQLGEAHRANDWKARFLLAAMVC